MENLLKSLNYDNPNFYNDNVSNVHPKFEAFHRQIDEDPKKNKYSLELIELLINLTSPIKLRTKEDLEKEWGHEYLFNLTLKGLDNDVLNVDDVNHIVRIFKQIASLKTQTRLLIDVYSNLLRRVKGQVLLTKFSKKEFLMVIEAMKVNFQMDNDYFKLCYQQNPDDNLERIAILYQDSQIRSTYRFAVEGFFESMNEEQFAIVLPSIQEYFEYLVFLIVEKILYI